MLSPRTIEQVRDLSVHQVLSHYLELKKKGSAFQCCCPFHSERTPSFYLNLRRNYWKCYGCGEYGSPIDFVMKHRNLSFSEAVEEIANTHHIEVKYLRREQTQQEVEEAKKRESMLIALKTVQLFFTEQLQADNPEAKAAREYAYARWGEEFCNDYGIGFAPRSSAVFMEWARKKCISLEILKELELLQTSENTGNLYFFYRNRVTIPIANRYNQIIGWTARSLSDDNAGGKYINPKESPIYQKKNSVFGIESAQRASRQTGRYILVEGAPDVLRLQILGFAEAVAPLGTAWTDEQFKELKRTAKSVCFIPDSDYPKPGAAYGPGILAVMKNGAAAMQAGMDVTVREIPRTDEDDLNKVKRDADSYITCRERFTELDEEQFLVWVAKKKFAVAKTQSDNLSVVREIADLLIIVDDDMMRNVCIDQLSKLYGKTKLWRDAIKAATRKLKSGASEERSTDYSQFELEMLRRMNIIIKNNNYYVPSDKEDGLRRQTNFIMRPVLHVKDPECAIRVFKLINEFGDEDLVEFPVSELININSFKKRLLSIGKYAFKGKAEFLDSLMEYLAAITDSAYRVERMGWDKKHEYYAFSNGLYIGDQWFTPDQYGVVRYGSKAFYHPLFSDIHSEKEDNFAFERRFVHHPNYRLTLQQFISKFIEVYGDAARVAFAYYLAALFRDHINLHYKFFPIFFLTGIPGSGKSALGMVLSSLFYTMSDNKPDQLGNTSIPSYSYMVSHAVNTVLMFDEYTNDLNPKFIDIIKGAWGGKAQTKMDTGSMNGGIQSSTYRSGIVICGQHTPTRDSAILTRAIHLHFSKTEFTDKEHENFNELMEMVNSGATSITLDLLKLRDKFIESYNQTYAITRKELKNAVGNKVDDRPLDNYTCILTAFRVLETSINVCYTYAELFKVCVKTLVEQSARIKRHSDLADFWNLLDSLNMHSKIQQKSHFAFVHTHSFTDSHTKKSIEFNEARTLIYLNYKAIEEVIFPYTQGSNPKLKLDTGSIEAYLKGSPHFLGRKQQRFVKITTNRTQAITYEIVGTKSVKVEEEYRQYALVFDYKLLKEEFELSLESIKVRDGDNIDDEEKEEENVATPKPVPTQNSLFESDAPEMPF